MGHKNVHEFSILKPLVAKPAGKCIYCGETKGKLTLEHVIPEGMNGFVQIPEASCDGCQRKIGEFETICMKRNFIGIRTHFRYKQKNGKKKKKSGHGRATHWNFYPTGTETTGPSDETVPVEYFKPRLLVPALPPPGIVCGGGPSCLLPQYTLIWAHHKDNEKAIEERYGEFSISSDFNVIAFMLLCAKIAHGLAWVQMGPDRFTHWLPDLILEKDLSLPPYLVGCVIPSTEIEKSNDEQVFSVGLLNTEHGMLVYVTISLFHQFPVPQFSVIVGKYVGGDEYLEELDFEVTSSFWLRAGSRQFMQVNSSETNNVKAAKPQKILRISER